MICASIHLYHRNKLKEKSVSLLLGNDIALDENLRLLGVHLDKNLDRMCHLQKIAIKLLWKTSHLKKTEKIYNIKAPETANRLTYIFENRPHDYLYSPLTNVQLNSL